MNVHLTSRQFALALEQDRVLKMRANPPEVMNPTDLSIYLGLSESLIYHKAALGEIPGRKEGTRTLFLLGEIRKWLSARKRQ